MNAILLRSTDASLEVCVLRGKYQQYRGGDDARRARPSD